MTVDAKDNSTSTFVNPLNPMDGGQTARPQETAPAPPRGKAAAVEMIKVEIGAQSRIKAKRRSYERRQLSIKRLNKKRRDADATDGVPLHLEHPSKGTAMHDYKSSEEDEISLRQGDIVKQIVSVGGGWGYGTNISTGETGTFPLSFVG